MPTSIRLSAALLLCVALAGAESEVGGFTASFHGQQPAAGWSYLWNAEVAIGASAGYKPLVWTEKGYAPSATHPDTASPANYLILGRGFGHPGVAAGAARDGIDRYAIAAYTVPAGQAGTYRLADGTIRRGEGGGSDGAVELRVYVNDRQVLTQIAKASAQPQPFAAELGALAAGDRVYVAVGPAGSDVSDSFKLDFRLLRRE